MSYWWCQEERLAKIATFSRSSLVLQVHWHWAHLSLWTVRCTFTVLKGVVIYIAVKSPVVRQSGCVRVILSFMNVMNGADGRWRVRSWREMWRNIVRSVRWRNCGARSLNKNWTHWKLRGILILSSLNSSKNSSLTYWYVCLLSVCLLVITRTVSMNSGCTSLHAEFGLIWWQFVIIFDTDTLKLHMHQFALCP